ncbi:hypothetical protein [Paenibacillus sp. P46E]|uniref:LexA family protein n=1 Tax=Paenibacillus sp. P46E TaxID=1349436 RepID=UPI00093F8FE9|nr:hypothetical protein [Paenibacillus sp. P46E]OKP95087.1 hypothetical protein A3849_27805 [Paenibacillus sp. P46E]
MKVISRKQQEIIDFIDSYSFECQFPPTLREIAEAMGHKSLSTTHSFIERLEEKKILRWKRYQSRTIVLTRKGMNQVSKAARNKGLSQ